MGTSRLFWMVAVGLVLVVTSSASHLFEDLPPPSLAETRMYQEGNDLVSGQHAETPDVDEKNILGQSEEERALFLIKIMQALRMQNEEAGTYRRAIPESMDFMDITNVPEGYGHDEGKAAIVKRLSGDPKPVVKTVVKPQSSYEAQRRWKAKKGTQMLCYFKLCSFHLPT